MLRLLVLLIVAGALAWAGTTLFADPGEVVIRSSLLGTVFGADYGGEVTMTFAQLVVFILLFAIAVLLLVLLLRLGFAGLGALFASLFAGGDARGRELRGFRALTQGLIATAAGDKVAAHGYQQRAEKALGANHAGSLLLGAQAAELDGDVNKAQERYRQMLRTPETAFLGVKGLLTDALASGDDEVALELARRAARLRPHNAWAVNTLIELLVRDGQWGEALVRVSDLESSGSVSEREANRKAALLGHMLAQHQAQEGDLATALKTAETAAQRDRSFAPASVGAASIANQMGNGREAERILEAAFAVAPNPDLVAAYLELGGDTSPSARAERFGRLFRKNNVSAASLAQHIGFSLAVNDNAAAQVAADKLANNPRATAGALRAAADAYRATDANSPRIAEFSELADRAPADPAWVDQITGQVVDAWSPFGPGGDFDSLRWQSPPRVATLVGTVGSDDRFQGTTVDVSSTATAGA